MDRKFLLTAFAYAILGLALGIYMAASKNHNQLVTHAHIMLVGFVVSFIYALCHKLWLDNTTSRLAVVQFYTHQAGALFLLTGLFLFYGNFINEKIMDPFLGVSSFIVFIGVVLMTILFIKPAESI